MPHTPGPWRFVPAGNRPEIESEDGKVLVARVESLSFIADARLIAAAPDLLDAAYAAWELIKQGENVDGETHVRAYDKIKAAIAKATPPLPTEQGADR